MSTQNYYVFDTSAFIALYQTSTQIITIPERIWRKLDELMRARIIVSHRLVYDEIVSSTSSGGDSLSNWVSDKRAMFPPRSSFQVVTVSEIIQKFPKLIDHKKERSEADPWVIAQAIKLKQQPRLTEANTQIDCAVVTQENPRSPEKMPKACESFGIRCMKIVDFFNESDISLR